jgi:hypothetical protein
MVVTVVMVVVVVFECWRLGGWAGGGGGIYFDTTVCSNPRRPPGKHVTNATMGKRIKHGRWGPQGNGRRGTAPLSHPLCPAPIAYATQSTKTTSTQRGRIRSSTDLTKLSRKRRKSTVIREKATATQERALAILRVAGAKAPPPPPPQSAQRP